MRLFCWPRRTQLAGHDALVGALAAVARLSVGDGKGERRFQGSARLMRDGCGRVEACRGRTTGRALEDGAREGSGAHGRGLLRHSRRRRSKPLSSRFCSTGEGRDGEWRAQAAHAVRTPCVQERGKGEREREGGRDTTLVYLELVAVEGLSGLRQPRDIAAVGRAVRRRLVSRSTGAQRREREKGNPRQFLVDFFFKLSRSLNTSHTHVHTHTYTHARTLPRFQHPLFPPLSLSLSL